MNWINLDSIDKLNEVKELSRNKKVLILKYSVNCGVSYIVRSLLEREWNEGEMKMPTYILDVIGKKDISKQAAIDFGVEHESPQVLIIENTKPVFTGNHGKVIFSEIRKFAN